MDYQDPNEAFVQKLEEIIADLPSILPPIFLRAKEAEGVIN
jgi:hypothetical protein